MSLCGVASCLHVLAVGSGLCYSVIVQDEVISDNMSYRT